MIGGGDRNRGDTGQRGVSLGSLLIADFCGTGALIVKSEEAGWSWGIDVAERARCVAAAEGGFIDEVDRAGLTSW